MIDRGFTTKQVPYYVESTNFVSSGSRNKNAMFPKQNMLTRFTTYATSHFDDVWVVR